MFRMRTVIPNDNDIDKEEREQERETLLPHTPKTFRSKALSSALKQNPLHLCLGVFALLCVLWFISLSRKVPSERAVLGAWDGSFRFGQSSPRKNVYHVAVVADLDKKSKVEGAKSGLPKEWRSILLEGVLRMSGDHVTIEWDAPGSDLKSGLSEASRGMELSELAVFCDRLWTFDDRSGIAFEITRDKKVVPRVLLMEGNGHTGKGQKSEWATVYGSKLYVGSFGKEYVNAKTGEITSTANLWVSVIDQYGTVTHEDWASRYNALRAATNTIHPGYMIIEAIEWSDVHKRWFVLPRRVSVDEYDEEKDESRGSNIVLSASEDFSDVRQWTAGNLIPTHGFSSFKFLPESGDSIVVALKTEEKEAEGTQTTHIMVFETLTGKVLMEETEIPGGVKFEGIAVL